MPSLLVRLTVDQNIWCLTHASNVENRGSFMRKARQFVLNVVSLSTGWDEHSRPQRKQTPSSGERLQRCGMRGSAFFLIRAGARLSHTQNGCATLQTSLLTAPNIHFELTANVCVSQQCRNGEQSGHDNIADVRKLRQNALNEITPEICGMKR